jgi:hypothetical protein
MGLSLENPAGSLDTLIFVGQGFFGGHIQLEQMAGPMGVGGCSIPAKEMAQMAKQAALVVDFASNTLVELTFFNFEMVALRKVLEDAIPDADKEKVSVEMAALRKEWQARREAFVKRIPALMKLHQSLGAALAQAVKGELPAEEPATEETPAASPVTQ